MSHQDKVAPLAYLRPREPRHGKRGGTITRESYGARRRKIALGRVSPKGSRIPNNLAKIM